jgi:hypothetical protein
MRTSSLELPIGSASSLFLVLRFLTPCFLVLAPVCRPPWRRTAQRPARPTPTARLSRSGSPGSRAASTPPRPRGQPAWPRWRRRCAARRWTPARGGPAAAIRPTAPRTTLSSRCAASCSTRGAARVRRRRWARAGTSGLARTAQRGRRRCATGVHAPWNSPKKHTHTKGKQGDGFLYPPPHTHTAN